MIRLALIAIVALLGACQGKESAGAAEGAVRVVGTGFELTSGGQTLRSPDLVGATLEMGLEDGSSALVRIDAVTPDKDRPQVLLHSLSRIDAASGAATPLCEPDAQGRTLGFPVAGRFDETGAFVADPDAWLLTCTSGARGKCLLWGYDPWGHGPHGESLIPLYEACQHLARAAYEGGTDAATKTGTQIDVWDNAGVQNPTRDADYVFEAGWGPKGAVCVARTRWPDLLTLEALVARRPDLGPPCTEQTARAKGAVLFSAVHPKQ